MSSGKRQNSPHNRARRHFLGVAGAITATVVASSAADAMGHKTWRKGGNKGSGSGSGSGSSGQNCFLRGTSIMTPTGEAVIEELKVGDLVVTMRGHAVPIKWVGHQRYKNGGKSWHESVVPIKVSRHALDDRTPHKDLYLSPNHALYIDGVLIRVKDLVNGATIAPATPSRGEVLDYYHIVLDTHEVIQAEGLAAETLLVRESNYEHFTNFADYKRLYANEAPVAMTPFAPIVGYEGGREHLKALLRIWASPFVKVSDPIEKAYQRIAARADQLVS
ncbi:Hint domain-containing protein [Phyllobacterium sp. BT25]|uniref:Hint domain-containing protein n=1 Tax=Phyllobacterium pellucidum TaxID=2740464 RepID=A0A849VSG0_9HYPH|nr:Hint domain-containing protein [Phyllobacterium pellucidum]NTS32935.1 Hint domain-containing protein [Phyllobacterium pellucidum]